MSKHMTLLIQFALIALTGPHGQSIFVNPHEVTSLREPRGMSDHFAPGTKCVIVMTNGNILAVTDPCQGIREQIEAAGRSH